MFKDVQQMWSFPTEAPSEPYHLTEHTLLPCSMWILCIDYSLFRNMPTYSVIFVSPASVYAALPSDAEPQACTVCCPDLVMRSINTVLKWNTRSSRHWWVNAVFVAFQDNLVEEVTCLVRQISLTDSCKGNNLISQPCMAIDVKTKLIWFVSLLILIPPYAFRPTTRIWNGGQWAAGAHRRGNCARKVSFDGWVHSSITAGLKWPRVSR